MDFESIQLLFFCKIGFKKSGNFQNVLFLPKKSEIAEFMVNFLDKNIAIIEITYSFEYNWCG